MLNSIDLRPAQLELLQTVAFELSQISGVVAVVLGGSHARGSARPDSDLDIGIYYSEKSELNPEQVRDCAKRFSLQDRPPIVTNFYEWGPWVNGGAWIHSSVGKVNFLYLGSGRDNSRVCLRWTWTPVVPGSEVTVPFRMRVYRTFPPVAPITSEYEWAKAMKADLLIIVRRVAWKFSEGELTELYRLWRHWCAEVERLAPGPSGS